MKCLKFILIILIINCCKSQENNHNIIATWHKIEKKGNGYLLIDCGYEGEWIKIKEDSVYEHGIMEDSKFKIKKIKESKNNISIFIDNDDAYQIEWVDKTQNIIKILSPYNNDKKYYISEPNLNKIKKVKGNSKDCISSDEFDVPEEKSHNADIRKNFSADGIWKVKCNDGIASLSIKNNEATLIVLFNQIYIDLIETKRYDYEKGIAYRLKELPEDSGSFGATLPWKDYLNDKVIAYVKVIDENTINFYWYGFYNNKTKRREITKCEFENESLERKEIILTKCFN